jgi:hypothetical protein
VGICSAAQYSGGGELIFGGDTFLRLPQTRLLKYRFFINSEQNYNFIDNACI